MIIMESSDSEIENIDFDLCYIKTFIFNKTYTDELFLLQKKYDSIVYAILSNNITFLKNKQITVVHTELIQNRNSSIKSKKPYIWYGLHLNMMLVSTIYYLLLKFIAICYKYRERCKCCLNQKIDLTSKEIELSTNINAILSQIGQLQCGCKYKTKLTFIYKEDYFNIKQNYNILTKHIPIIISLSKQIFKIFTNIEELYVIKSTRCIHEDIRIVI